MGVPNDSTAVGGCSSVLAITRVNAKERHQREKEEMWLLMEAANATAKEELRQTTTRHED